MRRKKLKRILFSLLVVTLFAAPIFLNNVGEPKAESSSPDFSNPTIVDNGDSIYPDIPYKMIGTKYGEVHITLSPNALGESSPYYFLMENLQVTTEQYSSGFQFDAADSISADAVIDLNIYVKGTCNLSAGNHSPLYIAGNGQRINVSFHFMDDGASHSILELSHLNGDCRPIMRRTTATSTVAPSLDIEVDGKIMMTKLSWTSEIVETDLLSDFSLLSSSDKLELVSNCSYNSYVYDSINAGHHNVVCSICGEYITTEECIYTPIAIAYATCEEDGSVTYTCTKCGHSYQLTLVHTGHDYGDYVANGDRTHSHVCDECGRIETGDCVFTSRVEREATCEEDGIISYTCDICGYSYQETMPHEGHKYGDYVANGDRTHSHVCDECGHIETGDCVFTSRVEREATCGEDGIISYTCDICGYSYQETIPHEGHKYGDYVANGDGTHSHVCDECGHIETGDCVFTSRVEREATCEEDGIISYTCDICGYSYQETIPHEGHMYKTSVISPTCTEKGYTLHVCDICQHEYKDNYVDELGHALELKNEVKATTEKEGYSGDWYCSRCGELIEIGHVVDKISKESAVSDIKDSIVEKEDLPEEEKQTISEALETISEDNLVEIVNVTNTTYNELAEALNSGDISQEEYEEKVEIVEEITKNAVVVGAQIEQASEQGSEIQNLLPVDSGIDMSQTFNDFYQRVLDDLLGNSNSDSRKSRHADSNKGSSLDLNTSVDIYKQVGEFVDSSINKMTEAALLIRNCSGEKLKTSVKKYISKVSVASFRNFDKEAADNEFVENAKDAILLSLQQQVLASLENNYNQEINSGRYSGTALENLKEEYDVQIELVSDIEQFEVIILEVMRQKYVSIVNNKYNLEKIGYDEYNTLMDFAKDIDAFEPIYNEIFRSWALNTTNEYGISLEELSNAAIEDQGRVVIDTEKKTSLSKIEIIIISVIGILTISLAAAFAVMKIGKGSVLV